jgi:membrane-bound lytic murein transglycosylase D
LIKPSGAAFVSLTRPSFYVIITIGMLVSSAFTHAEEHLALGPTSATSPPLVLSNARNIRMEIIPSSELPQQDIWERIRNGFAMRDLDSPLIAKYEKWYADHPDYVARMNDRAHRYLYYITGEVERRGMPGEIALLPIIESAFNPDAYSTSRASGIWQFIPSTGKNFGMRQNWWYDGRRDIVSATTGALDYLQKLHDMFGDWELALAAYNWGEGAVLRAQERNRKRGLPVNYTSLKLPNETRSYVPKLLAVKNIIANPANYGLVLKTIPNEPYFAAVATAKHIDVKLAAELADISMEEFMALNPGHNRPVMLQGNNDLILLPVKAVDTFRANLEGYDKPLVNWQAYQPKKGERLDHLAPRFGISVEKLKSINGLSARTNVSTAQTLLVPINGEQSGTENEFEAFNMHLTSAHDRNTRTIKHIVRKDETLASIARRYRITIASLQNSNGKLKQIKQGQTLVVTQTVSPRKRPSRVAKSVNRPHRTTQHGVTARTGSSAAPG